MAKADMLLFSLGLQTYFDSTWTFGTAKFVHKYGKLFLHIPVSNEIEEADLNAIHQVVGMDMGVNFTAITYDSFAQTRFFSGKQTKHKRGKYKQMRKELQHK